MKIINRSADADTLIHLDSTGSWRVPQGSGKSGVCGTGRQGAHVVQRVPADGGDARGVWPAALPRRRVT